MKKKAFYDDPLFDYRYYWQGRKYEHLSEVIAISKLIEQIPCSRKNNLLEIGAGFGRLAEIYSKLLNKCVLLEPSQKLLNQARERLNKKKNLIFKRGVGEKIPFKNQFFDIVLIVRVLHHLSQPEKTIKEINRVLKLNGYFYLMDAGKGFFNPVFKFIDQPEALFTPEEIKNVAEKHNLKYEKSRGNEKNLLFNLQENTSIVVRVRYMYPNYDRE